MTKEIQLGLFGNEVRRKTQRRRGKRLNSATCNEMRWDLWTQETASEKFMALFFLDIRDFSPLTEREHARDIINIVRKLFSAFKTLIRIHHGRIIETTGDGFYAAFGFDRSPSQAVNDAVQAGHAILKMLEKLNDGSLESRLKRRIQIGIGVHAGEVATGAIDLNGNNHILVMGHAVTVASRIQSATKLVNNNFLISSAASGWLEPGAIIHGPVSTHLKGLSGPIEVYALGKPYPSPGA